MPADASGRPKNAIFAAAQLRFTGYAQTLGYSQQRVGEDEDGEAVWADTRHGKCTAPRRNVAHGEADGAGSPRANGASGVAGPSSAGGGEDVAAGSPVGNGKSPLPAPSQRKKRKKAKSPDSGKKGMALVNAEYMY
jgi:hypothetical protein